MCVSRCQDRCNLRCGLTPVSSSTTATAQVSDKGFVSNYTGKRISSSGMRFYIKDVTIWEVIDERGVRRGQAAT